MGTNAAVGATPAPEGLATNALVTQTLNLVSGLGRDADVPGRIRRIREGRARVVGAQSAPAIIDALDRLRPSCSTH